MKRKLLPQKPSLLLAAVTIIVAAFTAFGQEGSPLPAPNGYVNDYAGVIDSATKQQLETKLKNLKDTSNPSVEIAVAVVKTTGDRDIFDYSLAVARGWKIGSKDDDNPGALLFVAIDDRKYFTQVSRNLEDELPDGLVGSLQRQYLVPEFKKGNYGKGISDTIDAYIETIRNKGNVSVNVNTKRPPPSRGTTSSGGSVFSAFCCVGIVLIVLLMIFARSKGGRGGGGGGIGGALPWIIGSVISSGLSSGSSSSGSSWGGSSGGGFGGFGGGGDFGGGGAGGSW